MSGMDGDGKLGDEPRLFVVFRAGFDCAWAAWGGAFSIRKKRLTPPPVRGGAGVDDEGLVAWAARGLKGEWLEWLEWVVSGCRPSFRIHV